MHDQGSQRPHPSDHRNTLQSWDTQIYLSVHRYSQLSYYQLSLFQYRSTANTHRIEQYRRLISLPEITGSYGKL